MSQPQRDLSVTMRFDPEEGIPNLDVYLDQLKRDADAAGFKFDHHAAMVAAIRSEARPSP